MPSCTVYYIDTQNRLQDCVKLISLHSWVCQLGQSRKVPVKLNRSSSTAGDELQNEFQNLGRSQSGEAPVRGMSWVQPQCHRHTPLCHPSLLPLIPKMANCSISPVLTSKQANDQKEQFSHSVKSCVQLWGLSADRDDEAEFEAELKVWQRFVFLTLLLSSSKKIISEKWFYPNIAWR